MRKFGYNLLLILGLMTIFGMFSGVLANSFMVTETNDVSGKIPKGMSRLSVKTDEPMTVYLDGVQVGKTQGNQVEFLYDVTPGNHEVKIMNTDGKDFTRTYTFEKGRKNCICLKTNVITKTTPCPYNIRVDGPERVKAGDLVTFAAINSVAGSAPINYIWRIRPDNARITSGLGTSSITVDTTGLGDQTVTAEVEATDGYYDEKCRQRIPVNTFVEKEKIPEPTPYREFDMIVFKVFDDDKIRLDNYAIGLQNDVNASAYVIVYQGTEGKRPLSATKMAQRSLDYLVKSRGIDPSRITIIQGGNRRQTTAVLYFVYPGGVIPVPAQN